MNKDGADYCVHCGAPLSADETGGGQRLKGNLAKKWSGNDGKGTGIFGVSTHHSTNGKGSSEPTSRLKGSLIKTASEEGSWKPDENSKGQKVRYCKKCGRRIMVGEKYCSACRMNEGSTPTHGGAGRKLWMGVASALAVILLTVGISFALGSNNEKALHPAVVAATADPQPKHTQYRTPAPTAKPTVKPVPTAVPTKKPLPTAAPQYGPGSEDIQGHDSRLVEPELGAWLAEYDVRYVQSAGGVSI